MSPYRFPICVIGQGAFLTRAVKTLLENKLTPIVLLTSKHKIPLPSNIEVVAQGNPNDILENSTKVQKSTTILLANNPHIISQKVLSDYRSVYNLHNSIVELNRGLAQNCAIDSMLKNHKIFGTSLQKVTPGFDIDASPTLHIERFKLSKNACFEEIMIGVGKSWLVTLDQVLIPHLLGERQLRELELGLGPYVDEQSLNVEVYNNGKYSKSLKDIGLGNFSPHFPKTEFLVKSFQNYWT